jgi:hypothetical protein
MMVVVLLLELRVTVHPVPPGSAIQSRNLPEISADLGQSR